MQGARSQQTLQQVMIVAEWRQGLGTIRAADHDGVWQGNNHHETVRPDPNDST